MILGASVGLGLTVWLGEIVRGFGASSRMIRRGVHSTVGLFVVTTPWLFSGPGPVYLLATLFVILNSAAWWYEWWPALHQARRESWGTIAMPIALIVALACTWSVTEGRVVLLQGAFLILAVADPLASWVGERWGRYSLVPGATIMGTGAFVGVAGVVTAGFFALMAGWYGRDIFATALLVAGVTAACEMISRHGLDNLSIVLGALLVLIPVQGTPAVLPLLLVAGLTGAAFGAGAYVAKSLTAPAAVAAGLYAMSLVGLGGWTWAVPGFTFFGLSSALSRMALPAGTAGSGPTTREERRTLAQVLANGGVAWGLLVVFAVVPNSYAGMKTACHAAFLGALGAAAADTWATEIGTRFASSAWSLRTGRPVAVGMSGAVSTVGSVAAVLGAASIAAAAVVSGYGASTVGPLVWISSAGVVGMFVDSLCGATIQARFRDPESGTLVETASDSETPVVRGWRGVDNNVVNLLGTTAGAIAPVFL